ncbi:hypothetical protein GCM10007881_65940 [Mesorhizobium huakuii]|uniref:hypothetical protein n=1 Tax=Mesorhizobium TaxID=68287 RepID=UPI0005714D8B|nr:MULTISPECIES: hypothetical protein [Mesorhizobium]AID28396.2 hypothetical protein MCHK_0563 [Mesorhizobium huakuii 7653R]MCH4561458.1 hypothetical protein [Mesorhizobium jarvisii]GLQ83071.1 hypothetical protein GCM10007881_65940 [Mesorhizobium huakuii]
MGTRVFVAASIAIAVAIPSSKALNLFTNDASSRTKVLALLETLNADLLSHPSATLTLEQWCGEHGMAPVAKIVARREKSDKPPPDNAREVLGISADEPLRYRRVQLACGELVLSEADNWYVPSRLTLQMNQVLDTTDQPFGKVVQPLHFRRQTISAELLWSPLPKGWEMGAPMPVAGKGALAIPYEVLRHRAILYTGMNQAFSLVVETYTAEVLAFGRR